MDSQDGGNQFQRKQDQQPMHPDYLMSGIPFMWPDSSDRLGPDFPDFPMEANRPKGPQLSLSLDFQPPHHFRFPPGHILPSFAKPAPVYGFVALFNSVDESPSTDATPESSDVEEDNRNSRKKRAKRVLTDEETTEQTEHSRMFPIFLEDIRQRLISQTTDGNVTEAAAITALIEEFSRAHSGKAEPYTLPPDCERWMREAADEVSSQRVVQKLKKKPQKSSDASLATPAGDKSFVCRQCPSEAKYFKTMEGLNLHIRNKHEKDKKWVCRSPSCNVAFVRQADLRMHMIRMHAPVRPFPCGVPFCLKSFAGVSELRRHVKVDHFRQVKELMGKTPISIGDVNLTCGKESHGKS